MPRIDESFDSNGPKTKFFSTLDLAMGYHHVPIRECDKQKTAFSKKHGLFQYRVMPFVFCNTPATFLSLIERDLPHLEWKECLVYIEDILIWSETIDQHMVRLRQVFDSLRGAGLKMKPKMLYFE